MEGKTELACGVHQKSLPRYRASKNGYYSRFYEYIYRKKYFDFSYRDFLVFLKTIAAQRALGATSEPPVYEFPPDANEAADDDENVLYLGDVQMSDESVDGTDDEDYYPDDE